MVWKIALVRQNIHRYEKNPEKCSGKNVIENNSKSRPLLREKNYPKCIIDVKNVQNYEKSMWGQKGNVVEKNPDPL